MAEANLATLQGKDVLVYGRLLKDSSTKPMSLIAYQTGASFDPSRDSDTTSTKSGSVASSSSISTDFSFSFVNNTSEMADILREALLSGEMMEFNLVHMSRKKDGKYYSIYLRGTVTEDSNDNDPDDLSTREITVTPSGDFKIGWTTLSQEQADEVAFVYYGVGIVKDDNQGDGVAFVEGTDEGANDPETAAPSTTDGSGTGGEA